MLDSTFYVYYRMEAERVPAARRAVLALFADMRSATGVAGRLACRLDDSATWMEVYEHVSDPQGFGALLAAKAAEHGLDRLTASGSTRKTEIFVPRPLEPDAGTACA